VEKGRGAARFWLPDRGRSKGASPAAWTG